MAASDNPRGRSADGAGSLPRLLVIRERDVGLFSMVWQVVNTMFLLEEQKSDRMPIVVLGQGQVYFHASGHEGRRTVWEYYFEPLVPGWSEERVLGALGDRAFELLESKRKWLERERGAVDFPGDLHLLPPLTDRDRANIAQIEARVAPSDWAWTEAFLPTIDGCTADWRAMPSARLAELLRRYIRPRDHVRKKALGLFERALRGHYVIGAHVRGTDSLRAPARGVELPIDRYFAEIERKLSTIGRSACRVFLATDEQFVVDLFEKRFGDVLVYHDAVRSAEGEDAFGRGPTGQGVPGYITRGDRVALVNGEDAVVEYTLLCQSHFLVHNSSSISSAARLLVADSVQL